EFLSPLEYLEYYEYRKEKWGFASVLTYFLMNENGNPNDLDRKIQAYVQQNLVEEGDVANGNRNHFPFEAIRDIHLEPNRAYIWIFGIIAAFILVLACINFINLATARALTRAKEVGVRKVLGSSRAQLIQQFFSESTLYVLCSVLLSIVLAALSLPYFNEMAGKNLSIGLFSSASVWVLLVGLVVITAFATGAFPALALSSFSPTKVIKGQLSTSNSKNRLRQTMVVFQFCVSSGLIISTLVVNDQLDFLQSKELGFEEEQVLIIRRATALRDNYAPFISKIKNNASIVEVSTSQNLPGDEFSSTIFVPEQPSNYQETSLSFCHTDMNFVRTLGLELALGRDYNSTMPTDSSAYLINETAAERLGWDDPVGKKLTYAGFAEGQVIGVLKDFNFNSLHEEIEPLVIRIAERNLSNIVIRLQVGNLREQ
ncbi:MAG: FtsX-like permease family protein, partial [Bacteroidota bacterium]